MWLVYLKELKELLRDRKSLFFMIALPILIFPLIFGGIAYFTGKAVKEEQSRVMQYAVVGAAYADDIDQALLQTDGFERQPLPADANFQQLIRDEQLDFVLVIPPDYNADPLIGPQSKLALHYNAASSVSMVYRRVNDVIKVLADAQQQQAFTSLGLSETQQQSLLQPIVLETVDVADERENWGEKIGGLVPYLIFLLCFQGAMFPATDIGAGEKERGTLETLLISPIERHHIILGKFLTIATAGVVSAMITVASMAIWGIVLSQGMAIEFIAEFMGRISALDFLLMFLMLVPVVAIFASVLLSLSIYARSFKEAQSYMGSLVFFVIIPVMLAMLPGVTLKGGWAWVPLTNVALAIKELIKGTMDYVALFAIFGSTLVIAGGLFAFCMYWFKQEKVLFR